MKRFKYSVFAILCLFALIAQAEDIDLFVESPNTASELPNVLIIFDNTANWNTAFINERQALKEVVEALPADQFRVGLMLFTETGGANNNIDGGYLKAAIRNMSATNKIAYASMISGLHVVNDKSNSGKLALAMEEAYLYFSGAAPRSGNGKVKTDYTGNTAANNPVASIAGNAITSKNGTPYLDPIDSTCAKNFIIYISNGKVQDNASDTAQANSALTTAGGSTTAISITPSNSQDNAADEWARFLKKSDLKIKTFTIDVDKKTTPDGKGWTALLKSMANVSSGSYYDVASSDIKNALISAFSEMQSVNSAFASVSLPVSVNTQGTYLNQIYIGMFRPDEEARPRWHGNLKQYKLGVVDQKLQLLDADSAPAINTTKGFIKECARSFWTPTTLDSYWSFSARGDCPTLNSDISNTPDGNVVEKGAQAYTLRSIANIDTARTMKTCILCASSTLINFNTTNIGLSDLGISSDLTNMVKWTRGVDSRLNSDGTTYENENQNVNSSGDPIITDTRASVHGDVVHSRPVAINYGTDAVPQVVVFYGSNDGLLRAINGNRPVAGTADNIGTKEPGYELWSFMPPEFHSKIKRLYNNTPEIFYPGTTTTSPAPQRKDYGFDGSVSAYKKNATTYIYASMRRGGRSIYAFDVSNPAAEPTLLWRNGCATTSDLFCGLGMTGIGQTWSSPKAIQALGYKESDNTTLRPLLIMGGGYDTCHDSDPDTCSSPKGKSVYVLDAITGTLIKSMSTTDSVVGDITIVPDSSGNIKYAYATDMGGNIYRISGDTANTSIGSTHPTNWTITKIAALGGAGVDRRKFMFGPDIVEDNGIYYILAGTGDREKPLASFTNANAVQNYFYMIKDKPSATDWLNETTSCGTNVICNASLFTISGAATPTSTDLNNKKGWRLALASGEKVVTSAITVFGNVTFSTHIPTAPAAGQCDTLGTATVYNISYEDAEAQEATRGQVVAGGGLPPSPVAGLVTLDNGETVPFIIGSNTDSPLQADTPDPGTSQIRPKSRVYWNIKK